MHQKEAEKKESQLFQDVDEPDFLDQEEEKEDPETDYEEDYVDEEEVEEEQPLSAENLIKKGITLY